MSDLASRMLAASALLASVRDIVDERPVGAVPPGWSARRGWDSFAASLSDDEVLAAERDGLGRRLEFLREAPADLVALSRAVRAVTALPSVSPEVAAVAKRRASPRKRAQVAAFAGLVRQVAAGASRIVDVGAGHGHLTRHLADELGLETEGWERDPARVAVASALTESTAARFLTLDVVASAGELRERDVVVGLHACGALGDHAVRVASDAGAAVALMGCCLQKRDGARTPLAAPDSVGPEALVLGRDVLGLGNARDGDEGVEDDLATRAAARARRYALRLLLNEAGERTAPGEEMRGINRRRANDPLSDLATHAFASRGVPVPSVAAVDDAMRRAVVEHGAERRHALARTMLARLVEVWVALDRAALLAARGYDAEVVVAFDERTSPRNLAVLGRRRLG
jgi:hypothetical protein